MLTRKSLFAPISICAFYCLTSAAQLQAEEESVAPPPIVERTLPNLPPEAPLVPKGDGIAKPPLAWRAGIHKKSFLSTRTPSAAYFAPSNSSKTNKISAFSSRTYLSSRDDAFFALLSACPQKGLTVVLIDSVSGQLIATLPTHNKQTGSLFFHVKGIAENKSVIEVFVDSPSELVTKELIDDVLFATGSLLTPLGAS